ncbi:two-component system response regulator [Marinomonas sp. PE14-40]|uniref:two-component system response regulator n=1 Tax=Marinomonas sp. PE14-40 TaxID=3060621 RepID=UPI003F665CEC
MSVKILIVDDYEDNRYTLKRRLKRDGYKDCDEAENGQIALEMLAQKQYDLVLLDLMMPIMDGFEVLEQMRLNDEYSHLPVIMISAADDLEKIAKGISLGAEDYLPKPFNPIILKARVKSALEKRSRSLAQINELTFTDTQTGLLNEAYLLQASTLSDFEQKNGQDDVAFVEVFFEKYGVLASSLGKVSADAYIKIQIERMQAEFNDFGTFYFISPGRFVFAVLQLESIDGLISRLQELLHLLQTNIDMNGVSVTEEAKVGVTVEVGLEQGIEKILHKANVARLQTNQFMPLSLYDDAMSSSVVDKLKLEADLRKAILNDELILHYQPQVHAKTGEVCAAEALVRWLHPEKGMISPFHFIPIAEESGMIVELGKSVIRKATKQIEDWRKIYDGAWSFPISVNVSAQHVSQPELVGYIADLLAQHNLTTSMLKVELTESALVEDESGTRTVLNAMQSTGLKISLDDFGTGFSSLSYLLELPLDQLKIDKMFVDNLVQDERSRSVFKHVVNLAHDLNLEVVVEGVEDEEQVKLVNQSNVDFIQGYYFYKPLPADDFFDVIQNQ